MKIDLRKKIIHVTAVTLVTLYVLTPFVLGAWFGISFANSLLK